VTESLPDDRPKVTLASDGLSKGSRTRKLHVGCGPRFIPGFTHVDLVDFPHVDHVADARSLSFAESNSVDLVYASHVLEHFGRWEFMEPLREWYRVLKPGGVLRLSVPDFSACAAIYYEDGLEDGLTGLVGLVVGGQKDSYDFHKMVFDEPFLTDALHEIGFSCIRRWDWREAEHSETDDYSQAYLPHMDKEKGRQMSLNLEASK